MSKRHLSITSQNSSDDFWFNQFEKNLEKAAVQPVDHKSIFDQINSVMRNSKSKFSTVEAAVEDMKERSGLKAYLDKVSIKTASNDLFDNLKEAINNQDWFKLGFLVGKSADNKVTKAAESIVFFHYYPDQELKSFKLPLNAWLDYTFGYGDGAGLSQDEKKIDYNFTVNVLKNKMNKRASDEKNKEKKPIVIEKYPSIMQTFENYIRDTKGNLPVPAIIEKVRTIHSNDVSDPKDWDDDKLIRLVSRMNLTAKSENPETHYEYNQLGSRTFNDTEIDPSNTDAFFGLNPAQ